MPDIFCSSDELPSGWSSFEIGMLFLIWILCGENEERYGRPPRGCDKTEGFSCNRYLWQRRGI